MHVAKDNAYFATTVEEGVRLARTAQTRLDVAEKRVEELLAIDAQGKPILKPFDM